MHWRTCSDFPSSAARFCISKQVGYKSKQVRTSIGAVSIEQVQLQRFVTCANRQTHARQHTHPHARSPIRSHAHTQTRLHQHKHKRSPTLKTHTHSRTHTHTTNNRQDTERRRRGRQTPLTRVSMYVSLFRCVEGVFVCVCLC